MRAVKRVIAISYSFSSPVRNPAPNNDGLSRFDGYEFVNYSVAQGLPHRVVFDLLITRSGDYWVVTSAGVAHFNPLAVNTIKFHLRHIYDKLQVHTKSAKALRHGLTR